MEYKVKAALPTLGAITGLHPILFFRKTGGVSCPASMAAMLDASAMGVVSLFKLKLGI